MNIRIGKTFSISLIFTTSFTNSGIEHRKKKQIDTFYADTKSIYGVFLNDILMFESRIQYELLPILLWFRTLSIVVRADIEEKNYTMWCIDQKKRYFKKCCESGHFEQNFSKLSSMKNWGKYQIINCLFSDSIFYSFLLTNTFNFAFSLI